LSFTHCLVPDFSWAAEVTCLNSKKPAFKTFIKMRPQIEINLKLVLFTLNVVIFILSIRLTLYMCVYICVPKAGNHVILS